MSSLEINQRAKSGLNADSNQRKQEIEETMRRRGDIDCQIQPTCPYKGFWRKDTKTAGRGKGWCNRCLNDEEEKA